MGIGSFVRMRWLWKLLFDSSPKLAEKASFLRKTYPQKVSLHPPQHRIYSIRREILINSKKNIRNVSHQCQSNDKKVTHISHNDERLRNPILSRLLSWSMNHLNDKNKSSFSALCRSRHSWCFYECPFDGHWFEQYHCYLRWTSSIQRSHGDQIQE